MAGQFRYFVWDPLLIISQIVTMQCIYYFCLGLWIALIDVCMGSTESLQQMFGYQELHVKEPSGRIVMAAFVLNSLTCALGLWYIVGRTKQCLDFAATVHIFHLAVCWLYNSFFPDTLAWWLLNIVCVTLMCVFGEFLCMRTEMKSIPLSLGSKVDL